MDASARHTAQPTSRLLVQSTDDRYAQYAVTDTGVKGKKPVVEGKYFSQISLIYKRLDPFAHKMTLRFDFCGPCSRPINIFVAVI